MKKLDLSKYKQPAAAAKALYRALREEAARIGQNPDMEVSLLTPERSAKLGYGKVWRVMWEAGPDEWGIAYSSGATTERLERVGLFGVKQYLQSREQGFYLEPYHSFDVGFAPQ